MYALCTDVIHGCPLPIIIKKRYQLLLKTYRYQKSLYRYKIRKMTSDSYIKNYNLRFFSKIYKYDDAKR